ncbi:MAG: methionine adenosyltransferase domain-containing protein [Syntrophales bacterium]|jgi:S-adenosylmethionine synthetase|nr:methionine adenosyltransferase domain-containing protein [Syntrophales bacterium]MCK9528680.1 methionine adenosyltransferase domain-containing protein [Syntrophales bacterium]MDX9922014.1 methionine adenosyltransferase domain-containing protein [Syntrophales bacterium]
MLITSEAVKMGHPDIVADTITAHLIAKILEEERKIGMTVDTMPHCGLEAFLGKGFCIIGGEVSTRIYLDIEKSLRQTVLSLGYNDSAVGLNGHSMGVFNAIIPQSPNINIGTRADLGKYKEIGAGDQGIMFGFAVNETPQLLPLPFVLANTMMRAFETCNDPVFAPDGKGQVTVEYDSSGQPTRLAKVLMSNSIDYRYVSEANNIEDMARKIAFDSLGEWVDDATEFLFNPTGEWQAVHSCSSADSGITGRKLVCQLYGAYPGAQIGGGAIVNKTPEKVDCSAVFGSRYAAKNVVAAGLAGKISIQIAYAIGIARPMSVFVNTFGTGVIPDEELSAIIRRVFDFTPRGMIEKFDLLNGNVYRKIARNLFLDDYEWEKTDMVDILKKEAGT